MASILLKDVPAELHRRLKERAQGNRRSMSQEVLRILEEGIIGSLSPALPPLAKPKRAIAADEVIHAIRDARQ